MESGRGRLVEFRLIVNRDCRVGCGTVHGGSGGTRGPSFHLSNFLDKAGLVEGRPRPQKAKLLCRAPVKR